MASRVESLPSAVRRAAAAALAALALAAHARTGLPPDLKPLALEVYGLRGAYATAPETVVAVMGASGAPAMGLAGSWRVVSEDDPAYAYGKFVRPLSASVRSSADEFPGLRRHEIVLRLPSPLRPGVRYGLVAQGEPNNIATAAKSGTWFSGNVVADGAATHGDAFAADIVGLRRASGLGDGKILLEFGAGYSESEGNDLSLYAVEVNGRRRAVSALGRRTRPDAYVCTGWPWPVLRLHDVVLDVGEPLADSDVVSVTLDPKVSSGCRSRSFRVGGTRSRAVQANQVGYLPDAAKVAYLGLWLGSFPDAAARNGTPSSRRHTAEYGRLPAWALRFDAPPAFRVADAKTGRAVWSGTARFRAAGDAPTRDGMGMRMNLSSVNVWELDFTAFRKPGRYRLSVEGVGTSHDFEIGAGVYEDAFRKAAAGVYAQRCGIEIDPALADGWRRAACHASGVCASAVARWTVQEWAAFDKSPEKGADGRPKVLAASGGHHDAGDYNPRSHIDVAQRLFWAYELAPENFGDGQLAIPEAGNGIPDIVDEGLWAVRLWEGLQDADGGVYDGTESLGDPRLNQTVELDDLGDYAFAKDSRGSFWAAGAFATSARLLARFGKKARADALLARARRAYAWGRAHRPAIEGDEAKFNAFYTDPMLYAAAELFHTTWERAYHADFLDNCLWRDSFWTEMEVQGKWNRRLAAQSYLLVPREKADAKTWDAVFAAVKRDADYLAEHCARRDYPFLTHPWVNIFWGFGAYQRFLASTVTCWRLTGDRRYYDQVVRNCDNTLGANPMGISWIVGIGTETVRAPLHMSHWSPRGLVVTGIQCEGPVFSPGATSFSYRENAYPAHRDDFATLNSFADVHFAVEMDEGVVASQAETMAVFGLLIKK